MFIPFFLFTIGLMFAITICTIWGRIGGDEDFEKHYPRSKKILHAFHHWTFGLILVTICPLFVLLFPLIFPLIFFILGLGLGLFIDDALFHTYETYFQRKEC